MKKILAVMIAATLCVGMLAGCGHSHVWTEANCVSPKTCTDCGETEGEALGHTWTDATCASPKTCSVCGETEGDALEHQLTEANYQSPAVCTVCDETVGDVLAPDFVTYDIKADMEIGVTYDYNTMTNDGSLPVVGKTTITAYDIIESDDIRQARDGYEWHVVTFETVFDDSTALQYGAAVDYTCTDYYNIARFVDSADHSDPSVSAYTVNIDGEDALVYFGQYGGFTGNADGSFTCELVLSVQVPVDYDGMVVGLNSSAIDTRHGNYLYDVYNEDDFLLFRLNG